MANFNELSGIKQWGVVILGGAVVTAALYFTLFKSQNEHNAAAQHALEDKIRENNELESYRPKLKQMEQQLAELKQQLEIEQRIVPDEKQVDGFITMLDAEAQKAGVELRRYAAKDVKAQQYYTEVPFDIELDGPYYSALNFFDRVSKLERISTSAACWWPRRRIRAWRKSSTTTSTRPTRALSQVSRRPHTSVTI